MVVCRRLLGVALTATLDALSVYEFVVGSKVLTTALATTLVRLQRLRNAFGDSG